MLFDTHTHPYITFKKSPETILGHFFGDDSKNTCISIACDIETSMKSIELARVYPNLKATVGFHPCDLPYTSLNSLLSGEMKLQINEVRSLYQKYKQHIIAIGETGLDYYHLAKISEKTGLREEEIKHIQETYFRAQIRLAHELELPFVIHSRESNSQVLEILRQENADNYVFHCYSGDWDFTQKVLEQNPQALFGFGGTLTFKKSHDLQEVAHKLPLKHIILETDSPFLTPEPMRGREENEPLFVSHVLTKLQELRDESPDEIEQAVFENAKRFYGM
ncbi:TatD family hydrolase [Candidatus Gracilibacteria bacterium]|nr:TatD family hydrolase [Candidatus Gracilibacteria bacterium]